MYIAFKYNQGVARTRSGSFGFWGVVCVEFGAMLI